MAKQTVACISFILLLLVLMGSISSTDARVYRDFMPKIDSNNVYDLFKDLGYDQTKLEYYRRRSMQEDQRDRVAPGGPAAQHH